MTNLTLDDIKMRIESAVYVMKLLPPVKVQGYHSTMPDIIYAQGFERAHQSVRKLQI